MYCWPNGNIRGSKEESERTASSKSDGKFLERVSISPEFINVVPEKVEKFSASLNSKSIENLDWEFKVAMNGDAIVKLPVAPVCAVINLGASPVPGPFVILSFAPWYALLLVE